MPGQDPVEVRRQGARKELRRWTQTTGAQLLVVDPDRDVGGLAEAMVGHGVHVTWVRNTLDGLIAFGRIDPPAVVIAPETPGISPAEFVGRIRRHGSPLVIAGSPADAGPDTDPGAVAGPLLLAGASALTPRPYAAQPLWDLIALRSVAEQVRLEVGPLALDAAAFTVRVRGVRIGDLPLKEFELLRALMRHAPGMVTDAELRDAIWGTSGARPGGNTIAMHVARLRVRLADVVVVRRIRGRGYALELC